MTKASMVLPSGKAGRPPQYFASADEWKRLVKVRMLNVPA